MGIADLARPILAAALATALGALSACALSGSDDAPPDLPDSGPHPPPPREVEKMLRCEDGKVRQLFVERFIDELSGHGEGTFIGYCPDGCRSASFVCTDDNCTGADSWLCEMPPATGKECSFQGVGCIGDSTVPCLHSSACGDVPGVTCTCTGGAFDCRNDELVAVHARLVGKWRGTVTPPSFTTPYEVSLWIYPDGTYWAECDRQNCSAFYYGGDGPHPGRKITLVAAPPAGRAEIGVFDGTPTGILSALDVTDTRLAFTFKASWHSCEQPFFFELARE